MGMTPRQYFDEFVEGNFEDYQHRQDSLRHAFNAAVSAAHMADHYGEFYCRRHKKWTDAARRDFVVELSEDTNGAFQDVLDITNAYKHLYPRRTRVQIDSTGAIESVEWGREDQQSKLSFSPTEEPIVTGDWIVVFTRTDGSASRLLPILQTVVEYWRAILDGEE